MKQKSYEIKVKGSSKNKVYKYHLRHLFGVNLEDLILILGPEGAARLLHYYGSTSMYVPSVKSIRNRLRNAMIKDECSRLLEAGKTRNEVIEELLRKQVGYSRNTLKMKLVRWFGEFEDGKHYKFKDAINENLVDLISENYEVFKTYRIV